MSAEKLLSITKDRSRARSLQSFDIKTRSSSSLKPSKVFTPVKSPLYKTIKKKKFSNFLSVSARQTQLDLNSFDLDHIFSENTNQREIWHSLQINTMCKSFIQGQNCNIIIYGPKKAYTLYGTIDLEEKMKKAIKRTKSCSSINKQKLQYKLKKAKSSRNIETEPNYQGILPRALRKIFALTDETINLTYVEIQNEKILDLITNYPCPTYQHASVVVAEALLLRKYKNSHTILSIAMPKKQTFTFVELDKSTGPLGKVLNQIKNNLKIKKELKNEEMWVKRNSLGSHYLKEFYQRKLVSPQKQVLISYNLSKLTQILKPCLNDGLSQTHLILDGEISSQKFPLIKKPLFNIRADFLGFRADESPRDLRIRPKQPENDEPFIECQITSQTEQTQYQAHIAEDDVPSLEICQESSSSLESLDSCEEQTQFKLNETMGETILKRYFKR